jgi:hypothetical protein
VVVVGSRCREIRLRREEGEAEGRGRERADDMNILREAVDFQFEANEGKATSR